MKIVIPTLENKLCSHFGHCESFTFVETDDNNNILKTDNLIPDDGISCASAKWIAEKGADIVLAGGMGMRPLMMFEQSGIKVVTGCPEMEIKELVTKYLASDLITGENSCGGEHHHCHHSEGGCKH